MDFSSFLSSRNCKSIKRKTVVENFMFNRSKRRIKNRKLRLLNIKVASIANWESMPRFNGNVGKRFVNTTYIEINVCLLNDRFAILSNIK